MLAYPAVRVGAGTDFIKYIPLPPESLLLGSGDEAQSLWLHDHASLHEDQYNTVFSTS